MYKIYVIEDNGLNRASLESVLLANQFEIIGSKASAEFAWEELKLIKKVDLVLIDIHLAGEKDGIWLAEKIRTHKNIPFIYITGDGDAETVKKVCDTKPNGYLMKPYNIPTLLTTIQIAIEKFVSEIKVKKEGRTIYIKDKYTKIKLKISDIKYIKSDGNYISIFLENKSYLLRSKLLHFYKELPETDFLQVHQRYVINATKVSCSGKDFVKINEIEIPVSKRYREALNKRVITF